MIDEISLGVSAVALIFAVYTYCKDTKRKAKPRLLPLLEAKLENSKEDYFENLRKV